MVEDYIAVEGIIHIGIERERPLGHTVHEKKYKCTFKK